MCVCVGVCPWTLRKMRFNGTNWDTTGTDSSLHRLGSDNLGDRIRGLGWSSSDAGSESLFISEWKDSDYKGIHLVDYRNNKNIGMNCLDQQPLIFLFHVLYFMSLKSFLLCFFFRFCIQFFLGIVLNFFPLGSRGKGLSWPTRLRTYMGMLPPRPQLQWPYSPSGHVDSKHKTELRWPLAV